jgi:hypothetical protein
MKKLGIQVGDRVKTRVSYKSIPRNAKGIVKALTQLTAPAAEKNPFAPAVINVPSFEQAPPTIKVSAEPGEKQAPPAKTIRVTEKAPKSLYAAFSPLRESLRPAYVPVSIIVPAPAGAPKTIEINPVPKYLSPGTKRLPAGSMLPQSLQKTLQVPAPVKSLPAPKPQEVAPPEPEDIEEDELLNYYLVDSLGKAELHFEYSTYKNLSAYLQKEVKSYFNWSRARKAWVSKGSWNSGTVQRVIEQLNLPLKGKKDRMSFEDQLDRRQKNLQYKSNVYENRAKKLEERAAYLVAEREKYRGDWSFWTQPNVDTSGGRSFTRQRNKIIENYFKGLDMNEKAAKFREFAASQRYASKNTQLNNPAYVLKKLEEAQSLFEQLAKYTPDYIKLHLEKGTEESLIKAEVSKDALDQAAQKLAFYMQVWDDLPESAKFDRQKLKEARYVSVDGGSNPTYYKVHKVNPKNIVLLYWPERVSPWNRYRKFEHVEVTHALYDHDNYKLIPRNETEGDPGYKAVFVQKEKPANVAVPESLQPNRQLVNDIPVKSINIKREWFQNRATPYSERSVQNIVDAANAGQFNWANMDAVTLWAGPDSKLYMLSGHSRLEAFERLCAAGKQEFCNIPAKIATVSLSEAKKIALESNTLSTKETEIERAEFYRKARENFATSKQIEEDAKRLEGANWTTIVAYSYLYPSGKTWNALNLLQSAEATSQNNIKTIAKWIGNAVKRLPQLTVSHENEIYDWLVTNRGYGTRAGQISKETEFATRLAAIVNKRTQWGLLDERLNIQNNVVLSPVERQYNAQLDEAKERINELEKQLKDKQADLIKRGATDAQIIELTAPINAAIQKAKLDLRRLVDNRDEVASYAKQEQNLFSNMAGRRGARFKLYA